MRLHDCEPGAELLPRYHRPMTDADLQQRCPLCGAALPISTRYPRYVCASCAAGAVDLDGHPVEFSNEGLSGGLVSSSPRAPVESGRASCLIEGVRCVAEEAHMGGVVIQPASADGLAALPNRELLARHSAILTELQDRKVVRSKNNPTGDYAEWLVSTRLGLRLAPPSAKGYDATDDQGARYQIKARRVTTNNPSTQLGVIRTLEAADFEALVAVLFAEDWSVLRAVVIPHARIAAFAKYRAHVNGHVMRLTPACAAAEGVLDVTSRLQSIGGPAVLADARTHPRLMMVSETEDERMPKHSDEIDRITAALARHSQRATYGAVADLVGVIPQAVMKGRPKTPQNSWVVSAQTGRPTGYLPGECDRRLEMRASVISTAGALAEWLRTHP